MITADNAATPSKEDLEDLVEDRADFVQVCATLGAAFTKAQLDRGHKLTVMCATGGGE